MQNTIGATTVSAYTPVPTICSVLAVLETKKNLKTSPGLQCALNALSIPEPITYATLTLHAKCLKNYDALHIIQVGIFLLFLFYKWRCFYDSKHIY